MPNITETEQDQYFRAELRLKIFMFMREKYPTHTIPEIIEMAYPVEEWVFQRNKEKSCQ